MPADTDGRAMTSSTRSGSFDDARRPASCVLSSVGPSQPVVLLLADFGGRDQNRKHRQQSRFPIAMPAPVDAQRINGGEMCHSGDAGLAHDRRPSQGTRYTTGRTFQASRTMMASALSVDRSFPASMLRHSPRPSSSQSGSWTSGSVSRAARPGAFASSIRSLRSGKHRIDGGNSASSGLVVSGSVSPLPGRFDICPVAIVHYSGVGTV